MTSLPNSNSDFQVKIKAKQDDSDGASRFGEPVNMEDIIKL